MRSRSDVLCEDLKAKTEVGMDELDARGDELHIRTAASASTPSPAGPGSGPNPVAS